MKKTSFAIYLVLFYSCFQVACKSSSNSLEKNILNSNCVKSLKLESYKLSENNLLAIKQFLSQKGCDNETTAFTKRAIDALKKGDLKKVNLECLKKYFELNQKSPFNIAFGGVFSCDTY